MYGAWFKNDNAEGIRQKFLSNLIDLIKILLEKKNGRFSQIS